MYETYCIAYCRIDIHFISSVRNPFVAGPDLSQPAHSSGRAHGAGRHRGPRRKGHQCRAREDSEGPHRGQQQGRRGSHHRGRFRGQREERRLHPAFCQLEHLFCSRHESCGGSLRCPEGSGCALPGCFHSPDDHGSRGCPLEDIPGAGRLHEEESGKDPGKFVGGRVGGPFQF